jgi:hypothetical protein
LGYIWQGFFCGFEVAAEDEGLVLYDGEGEGEGNDINVLVRDVDARVAG